MRELLTTKQLQDVLQVDRVTIYRMLEDGRLRGFKVGGQWRFSREEIERWLQTQRMLDQAEPPEAKSVSRISVSPLPLGCIQAVQDIFAEACEVATVICSESGAPLTRISCPSAFCQMLMSSPEGEQRCLASRRQSVSRATNAQTVEDCHAGLAYLVSPVKIDDQTTLYILAGQFWMQPTPFAEQVATIERLAEDCNLPPARLLEAAALVSTRDQGYVGRISRLADRVADTLTELEQERSFLLKRLKQIAEMTIVD